MATTNPWQQMVQNFVINQALQHQQATTNNARLMQEAEAEERKRELRRQALQQEAMKTIATAAKTKGSVHSSTEGSAPVSKPAQNPYANQELWVGEQEEPSVFTRMRKSALNSGQSIGGIMKAWGLDTMGDAVLNDSSKRLAYMSQKYKGIDDTYRPETFQFGPVSLPRGKEFLDPRMWTEALPEQAAPMMLTAAGTIATGGLATGAGKTVLGPTMAKLAQISPGAAKLLTGAGKFASYAGGSRAVEGSMEGGDTYNQALMETGDHELAAQAAKEVQQKNMLLTGMDAAELALAFGKGVPGGRLVSPFLRVGGNMVGESLEESMQTAFQEQAMGDRNSLLAKLLNPSEEMRASGGIGALMGLGLGGAGTGYNALAGASRKTQQSIPQSAPAVTQMINQITNAAPPVGAPNAPWFGAQTPTQQAPQATPAQTATPEIDMDAAVKLVLGKAKSLGLTKLRDITPQQISAILKVDEVTAQSVQDAIKTKAAMADANKAWEQSRNPQTTQPQTKVEAPAQDAPFDVSQINYNQLAREINQAVKDGQMTASEAGKLKYEIKKAQRIHKAEAKNQPASQTQAPAKKVTLDDVRKMWGEVNKAKASAEQALVQSGNLEPRPTTKTNPASVVAEAIADRQQITVNYVKKKYGVDIKQAKQIIRSAQQYLDNKPTASVEPEAAPVTQDIKQPTASQVKQANKKAEKLSKEVAAEVKAEKVVAKPEANNVLPVTKARRAIQKFNKELTALKEQLKTVDVSGVDDNVVKSWSKLHADTIADLASAKTDSNMLEAVAWQVNNLKTMLSEMVAGKHPKGSASKILAPGEEVTPKTKKPELKVVQPQQAKSTVVDNPISNEPVSPVIAKAVKDAANKLEASKQQESTQEKPKASTPSKGFKTGKAPFGLTNEQKKLLANTDKIETMTKDQFNRIVKRFVKDNAPVEVDVDVAVWKLIKDGHLQFAKKDGVLYVKPTQEGINAGKNDVVVKAPARQPQPSQAKTEQTGPELDFVYGQILDSEFGSDSNEAKMLTNGKSTITTKIIEYISGKIAKAGKDGLVVKSIDSLDAVAKLMVSAGKVLDVDDAVASLRKEWHEPKKGMVVMKAGGKEYIVRFGKKAGGAVAQAKTETKAEPAKAPAKEVKKAAPTKAKTVDELIEKHKSTNPAVWMSKENMDTKAIKEWERGLSKSDFAKLSLMRTLQGTPELDRVLSQEAMGGAKVKSLGIASLLEDIGYVKHKTKNLWYHPDKPRPATQARTAPPPGEAPPDAEAPSVGVQALVDKFAKSGTPFHKSLIENAGATPPAGWKLEGEQYVPPEGKINGVVEVLNEAEKDAKKRINNRNKGKIRSGLDPADIIDYAIIGAAKIARGSVKFTQWSKEMVGEFGDKLSPFLQEIWSKAKAMYQANANTVNAQWDYSSDERRARERVYKARKPKGMPEPSLMTSEQFGTEFNKYWTFFSLLDQRKPTPDEAMVHMANGDWKSFYEARGYNDKDMEKVEAFMYLTGYGKNFQNNNFTATDIHRAHIERAILDGKPVTKEAVDVYQLSLPIGYFYDGKQDVIGKEAAPFPDMVIYGANMVLQHGASRSEWQGSMTATFGDKIKPFLNDLWRETTIVANAYRQGKSVRTRIRTFNVDETLNMIDDFNDLLDGSTPQAVREMVFGSRIFKKKDWFFRTNPSLEKEFRKGQRPGVVEQVINNVSEFVEKIKSDLTYERELQPYLRALEWVERIKPAIGVAQNYANRKVESIFAGMDFSRDDYALFNRYVVFKGWQEDFDKFGIKYPNYGEGRGQISPTQLNEFIAHVEDNLLHNPDGSLTKLGVAVNRHTNMVREMFDELVRRKKLQDVDDDMRRQFYFQRRIIFQQAELFDLRHPKMRDELKTPYRGYTKQRVGSTKAHLTDYIDVMHNLVLKFEVDNAVEDIITNVHEIGESYAIKAGATEEQLKQAKENGTPLIIDGVKYMPSQPSPGNIIHQGVAESKHEMEKITGDTMMKHLRKEGITPQNLKEVVANIVAEMDSAAILGARKPTYMVPEPLWNKIGNFHDNQQQLAVSRALDSYNKFWKITALIAPGLRHDYNNLLGDSARFTTGIGFRAMLKYYWGSAKLLKAAKSDPMLQDFLDKLYKEGVIQSELESFGGIFSSPIDASPNIRKLRTKTKIGGAVKVLARNNPFDLYLRFRTWREAVPRIAAYMANYEILRKGGAKAELKNGFKVNIEGLLPQEAVARIARHTLVDYNALTKAETALKDGWGWIKMPFVSWFASNFRSYANMGVRAPIKGFTALLLPLVAPAIWNWLMFPDVEDDLPEYVREYPHIITGVKNKDGGHLIIPLPLPSNIALSLLGANRIPDKIGRVLYGSVDAKTAFWNEEVDNDKGLIKRLPPIQTATELTHFLYKLPYEFVTGKDLRTGASIVPYYKVGTPDEKWLLLEHTAKNFFPLSRWLIENEEDPRYPKLKAGPVDVVANPKVAATRLVGGQYYYPRQERLRKLAGKAFKASGQEARNVTRYEFEKLWMTYIDNRTPENFGAVMEYATMIGEEKTMNIIREMYQPKGLATKTMEALGRVEKHKRPAFIQEITREGYLKDLLNEYSREQRGR